MQMPGKSIRPGDNWKLRRPALIGCLGLAVPAVVDMQYTYIGTEDLAGKTLAVLRLTGTVQGLRGTGLDFGGSVAGSASIAPETGQAVSCPTSIRADLDLMARRQKMKAMSWGNSATNSSAVKLPLPLKGKMRLTIDPELLSHWGAFGGQNWPRDTYAGKMWERCGMAASC